MSPGSRVVPTPLGRFAFLGYEPGLVGQTALLGWRRYGEVARPVYDNDASVAGLADGGAMLVDRRGNQRGGQLGEGLFQLIAAACDGLCGFFESFGTGPV